MALFDRWFGKGRLAALARSAELRGDLAQAAELFGQAGQAEDAARVLLLRGDGETDARARLQYFTQAARLALDGTETNRAARLKRAELLLALAGDATVSAVARHEVKEAARDLEAIGEPLKAAEAYARAGDTEGEARALEAAGDVERLELLLSTEQHKLRVSRSREERMRDVELMVECGRRREALMALGEMLDESRAEGDDSPLRQRANAIRSRRVMAPIVTVEVAAPGERPNRYVLALGREIVIGRTEGTITIPSNAISRRHLRLYREGETAFVRDLESRNGTQLRGANLTGAIPVGEGLDLRLGKEVPLRLRASERLAGAIEIDVAGETYFASLGPMRTPVPGLELEAGGDGWVELVTKGVRAFQGSVEFTSPTTLLLGDAISTTRNGDPNLRVVGT